MIEPDNNIEVFERRIIDNKLTQYPDVVLSNGRNGQLNIGRVDGRLHWLEIRILADDMPQIGERGSNGFIPQQDSSRQGSELKYLIAYGITRGFNRIVYLPESTGQNYLGVLIGGL